MPAQNKTQATTASVQSFVAGIKQDQQRQDSQTLIRLMRKISGQPPVLWGPSIIGFGLIHYKYESGREGDMPALAFAPRTGCLCLYLVEGCGLHGSRLARLGPYKSGKCCLYLKRLADVDMAVVEELLRSSYEYVMARKDAMHKVV